MIFLPHSDDFCVIYKLLMGLSMCPQKDHKNNQTSRYHLTVIKSIPLLK